MKKWETRMSSAITLVSLGVKGLPKGFRNLAQLTLASEHKSKMWQHVGSNIFQFIPVF
jgi:hypothetical protein